MATTTSDSAIYKSVIKSFPTKRSAKSITVSQSDTWLNWNPIEHIGPKNLSDAPVALRLGDGNYWLFGRYGSTRKGKGKKTTSTEVGKKAKLEGFKTPLLTTALANVYNAPGGLKKGQGGYHAWQTKDMKNWVHHGPVSDTKGKWMTTAEHVGNKTYFYYDFPNDQDPHLIIDRDLTDGKIGKEMGIAFKDPVSYTHLRAHETSLHLVCRLLLEKKK